ncbi:MAG: hypothetical protein AMJ53_01320 [Gammaproteobacteria bacterium SG8_11]|nr:MAG: hypothetical protein AMJ53_01320 [Gammaproteobacteria bacterium SG8_11]
MKNKKRFPSTPHNHLRMKKRRKQSVAEIELPDKLQNVTIGDVFGQLLNTVKQKKKPQSHRG